MKKILIITILFLSTTQAKPCLTDIYFGNGIWSKDKQEQLQSKRALKNIVKLDKTQEGKTYNYKLAYNPGNSTTNDIIEAYWQLKESGQITDGYFMATYIALSGQYTANAFANKLLKIVTNYNEEVSTMHKMLQNESFNQKHNVLFVGHSQGNLFGNKIYTLLTDKEKEKFRMVSVGTMANTVAGDGNYANLDNDYVVNFIPNSLKGDLDGRGHDFQGVYLNIDSMRHFYDNGSENAPKVIAQYVKSAYNNLLQTSACDTYEYYVWITYICPTRNDQELIVDIYGRPTNVPFPYTKQLVATDSRVRMPKNTNGNCTVQGDDISSLWDEYNKNGCYAYSLDDTAGNYHTLDYIANQTYDNGRLCTRYHMNPEVTEVLKKMETE